MLSLNKSATTQPNLLLLFLKSPDLKRKLKVIQSMKEVEREYLGMRFYCTSVGYLNKYYLKENISKYDTLGSEFIKTSDDNSTSEFLGAPISCVRLPSFGKQAVYAATVAF